MVDGLVVVRNERVEVSRRVVWIWRVICGERRRGREICFEAVDWVVLLIAAEVFNMLMLSCINVEGRTGCHSYIISCILRAQSG